MCEGRFADDREVESLVARVLGCTLPLAEWHHTQHLALTCWMLRRHPRADAARQVGEAIRRFNAHHGITLTPERGYHETLTRAWTALADHELRSVDPDRPFHEAVNLVVDRLSDKTLVLRHYTRERLRSWEARTGWLEPDLDPLP